MPDFYNIHPYTALVYFTGVILYSMVFMHPVTAVANVVLSFAASIALGKKEAVASVPYTLFAGCLITVINPLFNTSGDTVLFTYLGRNYTFEALMYGAVMAGIFISSINWFGCMGRIISSDKFMYIFSGKMPTLCLILTMVIGLIPFFQKKLTEISAAGDILLKEQSKTRQAFRTLNVAIGYAFEHAIRLSTSMKSRGYGTGKTTKFTDYKIKTYDIILLVVIVLLNISVVTLIYHNAVNVEITPAVKLENLNFFGMVSFIILLLLPCIMYISKELKWLYLKSKI